MTSLNATLAGWTSTLACEALPEDVLHDTKLRIADTIGLMHAGAATRFGRSVAGAMLDGAGAGPSTAVGTGRKAPPDLAAIVNGAAAHVLEFDDTHVETAIHVSSPVVAAVLAIAEARGASGRDIVAAVAAGNEVTCRLGIVAPGALHRNAYHPTAVFGAFGAVHAAGKLLGLDATRIAYATGIVGSQSAGLMAAWTDGTDAKSMHPGWSAHCGIMSARLAAGGVTGPDLVFEGPFGFFRSHVQNPTAPFDYARAAAALGQTWESRSIAFKPYPAGHFVHAFVDALLAILAKHPLRPEEIARIHCPIADFMVPLVAEPVEKKLAPATSWHCRVSLHWSLAEAMVLGKLDRHAYDLEHPRVAEIRALARKVSHEIDATQTNRRIWRGHVIVTTTDGRVFEHIEHHNRGSAENPLSEADLRAKFASNVSDSYAAAEASALFDRILRLESQPSAAGLLT
ncbi:MAG: MmgE/PrpD family protein [Alphaproteobacteria bacterium]|nr:MmgE/PrpD family protein [Alphaproteobacteria bacterium]